MASGDKVYICGKCESYGAANLEDLVSHMTNCQNLDAQEKDDEEIEESTLFEEGESSESGAVSQSISEDPDSAKKRPLILSTQASYTPYALYAEQPSPTPFLWNKKTAHILVKLVKNHRSDLESLCIRRSTVWTQISIEMQAKYEYCVTANQCMNKFKSLTRWYRKVRDSNLTIDKKIKNSCPLYQELDDYYKNSEREQARLMYDKKIPELLSQSKLSQPKIKMDFIAKKPIIKLHEEENSAPENDSGGSEAEPLWVRKVAETFERCHRENMKMQKEFIDVLKLLIEK